MSLYFYNGQLLFRNGSLAKGPDCCCGVAVCGCTTKPDTMYFDLECPDTSTTDTVTLTEISSACQVLEYPQYCRRVWTGSATLSCGSTVQIWVICENETGVDDDDVMFWEWDAAGAAPGNVCEPAEYNNNPPGGMTGAGPWNGTVAPPSDCDECGTFMNWTLRLS